MIAALFVQRGGVYWDLPGVDPWDEARDARLYPGSYPVVAHPPCARWSARKPTWLYAVGAIRPELHWGPCSGKRTVESMASDGTRAVTPIPFRDLLLGIARSVNAREDA